MNLKTKRKLNIMSDVYVDTSVDSSWNALSANTSVSVTSNLFVEVSYTEIKVALVVFDHVLSN